MSARASRDSPGTVHSSGSPTTPRRGRLFRVVLACLAGLCTSSILVGCWAPPPAADIDEFIEYAMDFAKVPGFSAVIVKNGEAVWAKGYGWANIEEQIPVTPDTLFMTGSVAKVVVGTAVMQAWEQGLIGLDADVNDYLPFSARNPHHPETPITIRMLLRHTSSILEKGLTDDAEALDLYLGAEEQGADSPITLREFLEEYLLPGGQWYSETENFDLGPPGTSHHYSNFGMTLGAYIVEIVSEQPFDEYCREHIFRPLGMEETSYRLRDLDVSHIAVRYEYDGGKNTYKAFPHSGHPLYPIGFLRTSVNEFARFLAAFMNGGELDGVRILKAETVEEMLSVTGFDLEIGPEMAPVGVLDQGLSWMYVQRGGQAAPAHGGSWVVGCTTSVFFLRDGTVGVFWLANSYPADPFVVIARPDVHIDERLLEEAKKY